MDRRTVLGFTTATLLCTGVVFSASHAPAQKSLKEQLVGTWILVSNENVAPDGTKRQLFGANPRGILMLDANGRYSQVQARPDRPKFKSNDRLKGTPEEIRAAQEGAIAHFGTWTVDEAKRTLIVSIEGSAYPNSEGTTSNRAISGLTADEMKYLNPAPNSGGKTESVYRRAK